MKANSEDISHNYRVPFLYTYSFAIYIDHIYFQYCQCPLSSPGRDSANTNALAALFRSSSATRRRFRRHTDGGDCMYEYSHQIIHSNFIFGNVKVEEKER